MLWSGVTMSNPIPGHDLRPVMVTSKRPTATNTCNSQGKCAVAKNVGGGRGR